MTEQSRKLAAIVFTDIVGFTKLSSENEPLAMETLSLQRDTLKPIVEKYNGRLYLAKDSRMSASFFKSTYKNIDVFISHKKNIDTRHQFQSMQSCRLSMNA